MGLLRRRDAGGFWAWFATASAAVRSPADVDPAFLAELHRRLHAVDRRLDFEVGLRPTTDELELVVSAGGVTRAADTVVQLVSAAPSLPGWRVTAFKPARPVTGSAIRVRDEVVEADTVRVAASGDADTVVLAVYVPGLDHATADRMQAAHLLLEQAVGERVMIERVVGIDWRDATAAPASGTVRLADLPSHLPQ